MFFIYNAHEGTGGVGCRPPNGNPMDLELEIYADDDFVACFME